MEQAPNAMVCTGSEDAPPESAKLPKIVSRYSGYAPPFDPEPIVTRLVESVPPGYLVGLSEIVLTNSSGLSRQLRRSVTKSRSRTVRISSVRGLYHSARNDGRAWIEVFVDNTLEPLRKGWWLKIPFVREFAIKDVLFHETGHHIHATVRPEFREREDVADVWKVRLDREYLRHRHPVLRALMLTVFRPFRPLIRTLTKRSDEDALERGWISRAEFAEYWKNDKDHPASKLNSPNPYSLIPVPSPHFFCPALASLASASSMTCSALV